MAKFAFLLMVHENPDQAIRQARALTHHGDCVAIHVDGNADPGMADTIQSALEDIPGIAFAKPVRCGWGAWSLVEATLNTIDAARAAFDGITHYFLMSGSCYPTKSRAYLDQYVDDATDIIEAHDFRATDWIRTGLTDERFTRRHWFNERTQSKRFYASLAVQRRLRLSRKPPKGLALRIGSQWWCLRAGTVERMLAFLAGRRDVIRFFRTVWIPDESFFQTLAGRVVPEAEIRCMPPTTLLFSDYGKPVVFHQDHYDFLRCQSAPFARKISPHARALQGGLLAAFRETSTDRAEGGIGTALYGYLAGRGRDGHRYAPRFWERAIAPCHDNTLLLITAEHRALVTALSTQIARITGLADIGYVFDEDAPLPAAMGNLERGLFKRDKHRHAFVNALFAATGRTSLLVAFEPSRVDVMQDIARAVGQTRVLIVDRLPNDAAIQREAERLGLLSPSSGAFERTEVHRALTTDLTFDTGPLQSAFKGRIFVNRLDRPRRDNAADIGHFLQAPYVTAEAVAREAEKLML